MYLSGEIHNCHKNDLSQMNFVDLSRQTLNKHWSKKIFFRNPQKTGQTDGQLNNVVTVFGLHRVSISNLTRENSIKCRVEEIFKIPQGGFQSNRKRIKWRPHIGLKKQFKESVSMFLCKNHCLKYNLRGETSFCSQGG